MTKRTDRRAACPRTRTAGPDRGTGALRVETALLRRRIEHLWSSALVGDGIAARDVQDIAVSVGALRRRIETTTRGHGATPRDVVAARDDVASCVEAVRDLVRHLAAT